MRIECRIPGADMTPYLACAAQLATGLAGIEEELPPVARRDGRHLRRRGCARGASTLREATAIFRKSKMLRKALGGPVVDHYTRAAEVEQEDYDRVVTDYALRRWFEKA
nr:glutamine synthetase [Salipiger thiooxidans]